LIFAWKSAKPNQGFSGEVSNVQTSALGSSRDDCLICGSKTMAI